MASDRGLISSHIGFSIELRECSHDMAADFPQNKTEATISYVLEVGVLPSHYIIVKSKSYWGTGGSHL
jgi:hypothetical protein